MTRRGWRSHLELRRTVKALLRDLGIESPLDVRVLAERLGRHRGRPIHLVPYPLPVPGPFGLWLATSSADLVLVQEEATPGHQDHIALHEIGHIISDHHGDQDDDAVWRTIVPHVPPDVVRRALRRTGYDAHHEREAEMVATVIREWATLLEHLGPSPMATGSRSRRLHDAFGDHQGWL